MVDTEYPQVRPLECTRLAGSGCRVTIRKLPSGRFQAIGKAGRTQVCSKSFPTRREAQAYYAREKAALAGGVDPRAGRARVRSLLPIWLEERKHAVSPKTYVADAALLRLVPPSLGAMQIAAVTDREITRVLVGWSRHGFAEASVRRFRTRCRRSSPGRSANG